MTVPTSNQIEPGSSIEENKILVEKFLKAIDEGNPAALDEYVAEDYTWHGAGIGEVKGRAKLEAGVGHVSSGLSDMKFEISMKYWAKGIK